MASQNRTDELPTRMAAAATSNESPTATDATPTAAASTSEPPAAIDTAAMDTIVTAISMVDDLLATMESATTAAAPVSAALDNAALDNESPTTMNATAMDATTTDTTTANILTFPTPASLLSHLNASLPLAPHLHLLLGTSHPRPSSPTSITDRVILIDDETTAWAQALVRITKLPDFPIRSIIFDFAPCLKDGLGSPAIHRLFTRASSAVWKRERGMGRSASEVVFRVVGWKEDGEEVGTWCIGVRVEG